MSHDAVSISWAVAFTAGVLSFLSPCVLPLIPGYIAFVSGRTLEELTDDTTRRALLGHTLLRALCFVIGFTLVFTLLGASASAVGQWLVQAIPILTKVAGAFITLLGLHMMHVIPIPWLQHERRLQTHHITPGILGAVVVGAAFAFGWTPCIGPILAGILALAATQETVHQGTGLLLVYSLGLGVPFLATALGLGTFLRWFARYKRFIHWGELTAGALLVLLGVLVFTNQLTRLLQWIPQAFYRFVQ